MEIQDFVLSDAPTWAPGDYPASATNIRITGDNFTRDGKPVFLLGFESFLVFPWLYNLLGVDFAHLCDSYPEATLRLQRSDDTISVSWTRNLWQEAQIQMLLRRGVAPYIQLIEGMHGDNAKRQPLFNEFPELYVNSSHFINWRFEDPVAQRIRENTLRSILDVTRRYPIFSYELFNEVSYMDYSPANLDGFRREMQAKYGTIEKANTAWATQFQSFALVQPPEKSGNFIATKATIKPANFSVALWVDWQKYIEQVFAGHMENTARFVKSLDKNPHSYVTVQATANLARDYSGGGGVYPPLKVKAEDYYGDEGKGGDYISQMGGDNYAEINRMIQPLMTNDLLAYVSRGKPVMDIEVQPKGIGGMPVEGSELIPLQGLWKFQPDNDEKGLSLGYEKPGFNDASWTKITVPGLWGRQGFADCTRGWYRADFETPTGSARVFLNGSQLADKAEVYLNGVPLTRTGKWSDTFALDITDFLKPGAHNILAVSIFNDHQSAGMYWGGIRGYLTLNDRPFGGDVPLTAGQMRSFLWEKLVHGKSGIVMSYAYAPDGSRLSLFNPKKVSLDALKAIPATKAEFNAVGDLVLENNRRFGGVALCYPFESGRARVYASNEEWLAAPSNRDLAVFYGALLFSHLPTSVVDAHAILEGKCDTNPALIFRVGERTPNGMLEKLREYAEKGGVVIIDHGSLSINDDTHQKMDAGPLAGIEIGAPLTEASPLAESKLLTGTSHTVPRNIDATYGQKVRCTSAKALVNFADGSPALTAHNVGKGMVYYLAAELPHESLEVLLPALLRERGIANHAFELKATPGEKNGRYIEASLFSSQGASLLYLHNWGAGPVAMSLQLNSLPEGDYRMREIRTGQDTPERIVSAQSLRDGISISIPSQDPLLLLLESSASPGRALPTLDKAQQQYLTALRPSPPAPYRVLVNASRGENLTKIKMLTAVQLLEEGGFEVNTNLNPVASEVTTFRGRLSSEKLKDYTIFMALGSSLGDRNFTADEIDALKQYVSAGGSLFIAGNYSEGPLGWQDNKTGKGPLASAFGIDLTNTNVRDAQSNVDAFPYYPICEGVDGSPLATHVSKVATLGMAALAPSANAQVVVRSGAKAEPANAPVIATTAYGKGRVVVMGDAKWLEPELLPVADNAQLFLNLMNWLAHREKEDPASILTAWRTHPALAPPAARAIFSSQ